MEHYEKPLSSELLYDGRILKLFRDRVRLENGTEAERELVRHPGGVAVLAIDGGDNVLFVRQYRYPYARALLELPAGKLSPGEDPAACGLRELEEETGFTARDYRFLGRVYPSPGYTDEVLHLYLARDLVPTRQKLDEDEFLTVEKIPYEKAVALCMDGSVEDAKSLAALLKFHILRSFDKQGIINLPPSKI